MKLGNKKISSKAVLSLTSNRIEGSVSSLKLNEMKSFFKKNNFRENDKSIIKKLFLEANKNKFIVEIKNTI